MLGAQKKGHHCWCPVSIRFEREGIEEKQKRTLEQNTTGVVLSIAHIV